MSYRFGCLPGHIPVGLHFLPWYHSGSLPMAPASVAVPDVTWGMLGNDTRGDCGVAGLEHGFMADAADTGESESFPDEQQAVSYYLSYTGGQDSGVVLADYLAHVKDNGYYGKTVSAYAPVAVQDINTLHYAVNEFDFAYAGITVYEGMMAAVQENPDGPWEWTLDDVTGGVEGGHCLVLVGYDSQWLYAVTWGSVVKIAYPAWSRIGTEVWAVITGELVTKGDDGHGISLDALQADLSNLAR